MADLKDQLRNPNYANSSSFARTYMTKAADRIDALETQLADLETQLAAQKVTENPWTSVQRGYDEWAAKPHNKKWVKRLDGTPIPNDLIACIVTALATK